MTGVGAYVVDFDERELLAMASGASGATIRRVRAVIAAAKGTPTRAIAESIGTEHGTVLRWIRAFNDNGFVGLRDVTVGTSSDMRSDYDAVTIREMSREPSLEAFKRRLLALADFYEGATVAEVAETYSISRDLAVDWRDAFNRDGVPNAPTFRVKREADLKVLSKEKAARLSLRMEGLDPEARAQAEAIVLSSNGMAVSAIAQQLARPRNWVVSTIKLFNATCLRGGDDGVRPSKTRLAVNRNPIRGLDGLSAATLAEAAMQATGSNREDLIVLSKLLRYGNKAETSKATGVPESRIGMLASKLRTGGLAAFEEKKQIATVDADEVERTAEGYTDRSSAAKLLCVARAARGEPLAVIEADTGAPTSKIRDWLRMVVKYGASAIPDGSTAYSVPDKPKRLTKPASPPVEAAKVPVADIVDTVKARRQNRGREVVKPTCAKAKRRVPRDIIGRRLGTEAFLDGFQRSEPRPFALPWERGVLRSMAADRDYQGARLAAAVLLYLDGADATQTSASLGVQEQSILLVAANLSPTLKRYVHDQTERLVSEAGITPEGVRRMSRDCPSGWLSKLRTVGYLAAGHPAEEVFALTRLDPLKVLKYAEELASGWDAACAALPCRRQGGGTPRLR